VDFVQFGPGAGEDGERSFARCFRGLRRCLRDLVGVDVGPGGARGGAADLETLAGRDLSQRELAQAGPAQGLHHCPPPRRHPHPAMGQIGQGLVVHVRQIVVLDRLGIGLIGAPPALRAGPLAQG